MKRRKILIGLGGAAVGGSALLGSGAFTRVESQRRVKIEVAEDPNAYLGLDGCPDSPNQSYTNINEDGHLEIEMSPSNPTAAGGEGVNSDSFTWFDDVFQVCNQGKQAVNVWIEAEPNSELPDPPEEHEDEPRLTFYIQEEDDGGELSLLQLPGTAVGRDNPFLLAVGECECIGIRTMTKGLSEGDSLVEDDEIVIHADTEAPDSGDEITEEKVAQFLEEYDGNISTDSSVFVADPVPEGTSLFGLGGNELEVPDEEGEYCLFLIDKEPNAFFSHPIEYNWFNTETGEIGSQDAEWWPIITSTPQVDFEYPSTPETIQGIDFFFGERSITGSSLTELDTESVSALQSGDEGDVGDDEDDVGRIGPPPELQPNIECSNLKYALVFDGGAMRDQRNNANLVNGDDMAKIAKKFKMQLDDRGYRVQRISQYPGREDDVPAIGGEYTDRDDYFKSRDTNGFNDAPSPAAVDFFELLFEYGSSLDECCDTEGGESSDNPDYEFVLVIIAHGADDGWFQITNPKDPEDDNKTNRATGVPYEDGQYHIAGESIDYMDSIESRLGFFPECVDLTILIISCYSGEAKTISDIDGGQGDQGQDEQEVVIVTTSDSNTRTHEDFAEDFVDTDFPLSDKFESLETVERNNMEVSNPDNPCRYPEEGDLGDLDD